MSYFFSLWKRYTATGTLIFCLSVFFFFASNVSANTVRILGPRDAVATTPSSVVPALPSSQIPPNLYGPTGNNETLWSIATQYRRDDNVSVYQVLSAIHRLNTHAFEENNLHTLQPGSILKMPTLEQIRQENSDDVALRLKRDEARLSALKRQSAANQRSATSLTPTQTGTLPTAVVNTPLPTPADIPVAAVTTAPNVALATEDKAVSSATKPIVADTQASEKDETSPSNQGGIPPRPALNEGLNNELALTEQQMIRLLETNHQLRVRMSEMQLELSALQDQVNDDEFIRDEILRFIEKERQAQAIESAPVASVGLLDRMSQSPLALVAAILIPSGLIGGLLFFFLSRRREESDDVVKALQQPREAAEEEDIDIDDIPDLALTEDDILFGGDLPNEADNEEDDELMSSNHRDLFSVNSDEPALGLEDMERALDDFDSQFLSSEQQTSPDGASTSLWGQEFNVDQDEMVVDDFNLASDSDDNLIDQSVLDELLGNLDNADSVESDTLLADEDDSGEEEPLPGLSESDALLDELLADEDGSADKESLPDLNDSDALLDELLADEDDSADKEDAEEETLLDLSNSDALLDELLADEDDSGEEELLPDLSDSDALLDELLADEDDSADKENAEEETLLDLSNSDALLDELLADESDSGEEELLPDLSDSDALLDELLADESDSGEEELLPDLSDSDALLDELLADESDSGEEELLPDLSDSDALLDELLADEDGSADKENAEEETLLDLSNSDALLDELLPDEVNRAEEAPELEELYSPDELNNIEDSRFNGEAPQELEAELADIDALLGELSVCSVDESEHAEQPTQVDESLLDQEALAAEQAASEEMLAEFDAQAQAALGTNSQQLETLLGQDSNQVTSLDTESAQSTPLDEAVSHPVDSESDFVAKSQFDFEGQTVEEALNELDADELLDLSDTDREALDIALAESLSQPISFDALPEFGEEEARREVEAEFGVSEESLDSNHDQDAQTNSENDSQPQGSAQDADVENGDVERAATEGLPLTFAFKETIDVDDIPEFNEDDAFAAALEEQQELDEGQADYQAQQQKSVETQTSAQVAPIAYSILDESHVDTAGLDMDALLTDTDQPDIDHVLLDETLHAQQHSLAADEANGEDKAMLTDDELLLPDDALLMDEDETEIWQAAATPEPELEPEDWSHQPGFVEAELQQFDSINDLSTEALPPHSQTAATDYISIDELMHDDPDAERIDLNSVPMDLDVGLDEFPDLLADIEGSDVDIGSEVDSQVDLAKAYIEMNDPQGAIALLEDVLPSLTGARHDEVTSLLNSLKK
ncbi:FimV/HubP family polar landmark protein [Thaumasiovibrio sp. DFM-14]|uniref:FimV/HubP family polar landmark protein n=1 Tax=Thaumasiovibrio sp. DFM-14 TaxID=3384792 RepID=UPI0039A274BF